MNIDDKQIAESLDRIGRTPDGVALYLFLQKTLTALPTDASADALREFHGRRTFAAELMFLMKDGVRDNVGSDPSHRPIVFTRNERARVAGRLDSRSYARIVESGDDDASRTGTK